MRTGRLKLSQDLEQLLLLAIAELTNAERSEDLDSMRERCALARGFISEALARKKERA